MNVKGGEGLVFEDGEGFSEEISKVVGAGDILNHELSLPHTVANPVQAHVDGLRSARLDGVASEAHGHLVVAEEGGGWLGVSKAYQDGPLVGGDLGVAEQSGIFRFGDGGANDGDAGGEAVDGAIGGGGVARAKEMETASDAAGVGAGEVGRVRMDA